MIFFINHLFFGVFGVVPQSWRDPKYATDFEGVFKNIALGFDAYGRLFVNNPHLVIIIVFSSIYSLASRNARLLLSVSFLAPFGFEILLVGKTGMVSPERFFIFFPFIAIFFAAQLCRVVNNWILGSAVVGMVLLGNNIIQSQAATKIACSDLYNSVESLSRQAGLKSVYILVSGDYSIGGYALRQRLRYNGFNVSYCNNNCVFKSLKEDDGHASEKRKGIEISF
jgi:hypothetical protein